MLCNGCFVDIHPGYAKYSIALLILLNGIRKCKLYAKLTEIFGLFIHSSERITKMKMNTQQHLDLF